MKSAQEQMVKCMELAHSSQRVPVSSVKKMMSFMDNSAFEKMLKEKVESQKWKYHKEGDFIEFLGKFFFCFFFV